MVRKRKLEVKLPYVQEYRDRHGKAHRYFRRAGFPAIPLPLGPQSSAEFLDAYRAAMEQAKPAIGAAKSVPSSVASVIAAFYESPQFRDALGPSTQLKRRGILEIFRRECGAVPIDKIERRHLVERLGKLKPFAAKNWLVTLREFWRFALATERAKDNPTIGIELVTPARKGDADEDGAPTWPEEWISQFEAHWPIGSKQRLMEALPLFTGQRLSDVVRMGPGMVKNGVMTLTQWKNRTRKPVTVVVPLDPRLVEIIAATPTGDMVYLTTNRKGGYSAVTLSEAFSRACQQAGLPEGASMHGLRKAFVRRGLEAGQSGEAIISVTGHASTKELQPYAKRFNRAKLAEQVIAAVAAGR